MPIETIRNTYFAFYQSIVQYSLLVRGGVKDINMENLQQIQNSIVRIISNKKSLEDFTESSYKIQGARPIRFSYKKIAIIFVVKKIVSSQIHTKLNLKILELTIYPLNILINLAVYLLSTTYRSQLFESSANLNKERYPLRITK